MSAKGRGSKTDELDRYYTPTDLAEALVRVSGVEAGDLVLEPHVGGAAFALAAANLDAEVVVGDLDPKARGLTGWPNAFVGDFLAYETSIRFDWIIGNPPYSSAAAHIAKALTMADSVAFLLRLNFLASARRFVFWSKFPPAAVYVLAERPSFSGGGTDATDYGWFIWRPGGGPTVLRWLSWRDSTPKPNPGPNREACDDCSPLLPLGGPYGRR
jgi:hypothetical protein